MYKIKFNRGIQKCFLSGKYWCAINYVPITFFIIILLPPGKQFSLLKIYFKNLGNKKSGKFSLDLVRGRREGHTTENLSHSKISSFPAPVRTYRIIHFTYEENKHRQMAGYQHEDVNISELDGNKCVFNTNYSFYFALCLKFKD